MCLHLRFETAMAGTKRTLMLYHCTTATAEVIWKYGRIWGLEMLKYVISVEYTGYTIHFIDLKINSYKFMLV